MRRLGAAHKLLELIPEPYRQPGYWARELNAVLGQIRLEPVPIPKDCRNGFYAAYWSRPHADLDPQVRAGISVFSAVDPAQVEQSLARLRRDLETGELHRRNARLLDLEELDLGGRLVVAEQFAAPSDGREVELDLHGGAGAR